MEFRGRIKQLLPLRSGKSERTGNEWRALPFIFEYFEHDTDRWSDTVLLETYDENIINMLKEGMEVVCGFGHRTREYQGRVYNEVRLYKLQRVIQQQPASQPTSQPSVQPASAPTQPAAAPSSPTLFQDTGAEGADDLPF